MSETDADLHEAVARVRAFAADRGLPAPRVLAEDDYGDGPIVVVDSLAGLERWHENIRFPHLQFRTSWRGEDIEGPVVLCLSGSIDRQGADAVEIRLGFEDGGQLCAIGMSQPTRLGNIQLLAMTSR